MQCLGGIVREERVGLDFLTEGRPLNQVGMEHNAACRRVDPFGERNLDDLSGSKADDGPVFVVIDLPSVADLSAAGHTPHS